MSYFLFILNCIILFWISYWMYKKWSPTKFFLGCLIYRIGMGLAMGLIYTYYYPSSDTWAYFHDAEKLASLAREDFVSYIRALFDEASNMTAYVKLNYTEWRSVFFVKILSTFCLLSHDNYWICSAYLSLLSFASAWFFHRTVCKWKPSGEFVSAIALILFPSVAFWSSGVEKESLAFSGLCILFAGLLIFQIGEKIRPMHWVLILLSLFILFKVRYFWLGVFLIAFIPTIIATYLIRKKIRSSIVAMVLLLTSVLIVGSLSFIHPNFSSSYFLDVVVYNHNKFVRISDPDNIIHFHQLTPHWGSMIINSPLALFSGLFRPFFWEAHGLLSFLASLENLFLLLMAIFSIARIKKAERSKSKALLLGVLSYIIILCIFLALSTPNFGSLSRYRIGFLPFFLFIICYKNPLLVRILEILKPKGL